MGSWMSYENKWIFSDVEFTNYAEQNWITFVIQSLLFALGNAVGIAMSRRREKDMANHYLM